MPIAKTDSLRKIIDDRIRRMARTLIPVSGATTRYAVGAAPGPGVGGPAPDPVALTAAFILAEETALLAAARVLQGTEYQIVLDDGGAGDYLTLALAAEVHTERLRLVNTETGEVVLQIELPAGQTANAIVVKDGDGNDRFKVSEDGSITAQRQEANAEVFLRTCSDANISSYWRSQRARGTLAAPTVVKAGDVLGYFSFGGFNGEAWTQTLAYLQAAAAGDWAVGDTPTYLRLGTTPVGSGAVLERVRIDEAGLLGVNVTGPGAQLHVKPGALDRIAAIIQAAANQTANMVENRNSSGTALSGVDKDGYYWQTNDPTSDLQLATKRYVDAGGGGGGTAPPGTCGGRLTLTSGTPVTTSDVTGAATVYYTPYLGDQIGLYNGATWDVITFAEASVAVPATTVTPFDIFAYNNGGAIALETLNWTNDATRATALAMQNGIYVKSGATTRRYLGTGRTTTVNGQTEDSLSKRFLWNYHNRVDRYLRWGDYPTTHTYSGNWRIWNNNAAAYVYFVTGLNEDTIQTYFSTDISTNNASYPAYIVPRLDGAGLYIGITTYSTSRVGCTITEPTTPTTVGYHYLAPWEFCTTATLSVGWGIMFVALRG